MNKTEKYPLWPSLAYDEWKDTLDAMHMKMQVAGKIKLSLTPFVNQWWNAAFYISATGINSGPISYKDIIFELNFDLINHNLLIQTSRGEIKTISLSGCSVAEYYRDIMDTLDSIGITVSINKLPSEVPDPVPCDIDKRSVYQKEYVHNWWVILARSAKVFELFRSEFRGKSSPVHFFWGSFDLSLSRFCGKLCRPPENSGVIMRYSENEENMSFGFWAGNKNYPHPAYYSYIYPAPKEITDIKFSGNDFKYDPSQGLFLLDYNDARRSGSPEKSILDFLQTTYSKSASIAGWDTESLKQDLPQHLQGKLTV